LARAKVLIRESAGNQLGRRRSGIVASVLPALTALLVGLIACNASLSRPQAAVEPSVAGVVSNVEPKSVDGQVAITLESGPTIQVVDDETLELGQSTVGVGDVVLYGSSDGTPWWAGFGRSATVADCYAAYADTAFDQPDAVVLLYEALNGVGIRLRKASDFRTPDPDEVISGEYVSGPEGAGGARLCLNAEGAVTRTR
jgi:hypothetical protein